ncbi:LysR family transcriptional regulator [Photobacterium halotolerans]|uniref:LysR family transcriptional regulator n=1 Tax=Photobacterium halotolerans TaxID=265726 RepID=UPI001372FBAB|nr:LysR family transcriptional regulator [Photobacterium halotolerans]NAW86659.1 LysR family transcriptional regulator [Photobacterium halotolerans]NAX46276.1 LysR family transcriptional regulator [Photobacterium halotolerans]
MSHALDLNTLPLFIATVEAGSFTAAAEKLGCTKTKISLNIKALEAHLGSALFNRTTRQVTLTEAGQQLYLACQPLLTKLDETLSEASTSAQALSGTLRITAPVDHMTLMLAPAVAAFAKVHPTLTIELRGGDKVSDMVRDGIDLAIRMGWLKDSSLRAQKLGEFEQRVMASAGYLQEMGRPQQPAELKHHRWIEFSPLPSALTWTFTRADEQVQVQMQSHVRVDNTSAMRSLIKSNAGLSVIATHFGENDPELVPLFTDWQLPRGGIYAVFPPGTFIPAKVRTFVDFYRHWLAQHTNTDTQ